MRGWASLFRRGAKPTTDLYGPLEETTPPPPPPPSREPPPPEPPPTVVSPPASAPAPFEVPSAIEVSPPISTSPPTSVPPAIELPPSIERSAPIALAPEEGAHDLVFVIMAAAPDLRYRAARTLGLLEGQPSGGGPEFERRLLERARDTRQLAALEQALQR
jgi:hypothetical protein